MLKIPRIAIFKPLEEDAPSISALFQRYEYSIRTVANTAEIGLLIQEEDAPFDCVIIPPRMMGGNGGVNLCLQLKTQQNLAAIPILALLNSKDRALLNSLYGAGVDLVMIAPFDPDLIFLQIGALTRQKRSFDELLQHHYEDSGMRHSLISAFNSIREGLIIFDSGRSVNFINSPGATLLGVKRSHSMEQIEETAKQFDSIIEKHEATTRKAVEDSGIKSELSTFTHFVSRLDNRTFKAETRVSTLLGRNGKIIGSSVAFSDMSGIGQLSELLNQAQRTRTFSLLSSAGCLRFLGPQLTSAVSPLQVLQSAIVDDKPVASLAPTLSFLLEILDLIMAPGIDVKVNIKGDWLMAIRSSDLLQILGHLTLIAAEHAILGGEIVLAVEENRSAQYLEFSVSSHAQARIRYLHDDLVSMVIDGSVTGGERNEDGNQKSPQNLRTVQAIASRYGSKVDLHSLSDTELRVSVYLPLAQV